MIRERNGDRERIRLRWGVEQAQEIPKIVLDEGFEAGGRRGGRAEQGSGDEEDGGDELGAEREDQPEQRLESRLGGSGGREEGDRVEREPEEG